MKLFSRNILAALLFVMVLPAYCYAGTVHTHTVSYVATVCAWCGSEVKSKTINSITTKSAWYEATASNINNAKVTVRITSSKGPDEFELVSAEPTNSVMLPASYHPVTITTTVDCKGAGLWETVSATINVTTRPGL